MNRLSTKDNKGYCICVAMLAVINVFIFIYKLSTAFSHLKWDAYNVSASIYSIVSVLSNIIAMASFVVLALLVVLQAFNLCSDKIVRIVFKSYIIFYSSYALSLFIVEQGGGSGYYTVFHSFEIILLTIFIILFAKAGEKTEKSKVILLIVVLSFLLLSIIMSMLTIPDSNTMFLICCIGRIVVSIAMVTSFCKNRMDNNILKIIGGIFLLLSFIDGISVLVMYKTFTVSLFIYFLSMVLQALPIFLYFLFYSRINTQGKKRKKHGIEGQLADLKEKLDSGLITLDEYNTVKQNILSKINI